MVHLPVHAFRIHLCNIYWISVTTSFSFLVPGRTYVLLFKSVTPEDMGEIKFMAEKASSSAKLKVKGKHVKSQHILVHVLANYYFLKTDNSVFGMVAN